MELIKKEEQKLFCSYELGTIEETDGQTTVEYEARLSVRHEPIIVFPDGDIAIITWRDILEFAKFTKKSREEESK